MEVTNSSVSSTSFTPLVSLELRNILQFVSFVLFCGPLSGIGILANIANIIVFVKQGFKESMNISLLGLTVSDLASLIGTLWASISLSLLFLEADLPFDATDLTYITGGYVHQFFNRTTTCLTAYIALERCLCVMVPLKVKNIITPARTRIIVSSIFISMIVIFSPFFFVNKMEWRFSKKWNATKYILVFAENRELVDAITFLFHSVFLSTVLFISIIICTVILVVKLNMSAKWRQSTTSRGEGDSKPDSVATKDKRVVKMVTLICTIFIACFTPATLIYFMLAYEPEFNFIGKYQNTLMVVWYIAYCFETISSSVNIFVYYAMSAKFREIFLDKFNWVLRKLPK